uniref:Uncharacterized protein n=1 Tax=Arundo donax TaxID=35708 RepID=A0A0A9B1Z5_ARUDO
MSFTELVQLGPSQINLGIGVERSTQSGNPQRR